MPNLRKSPNPPQLTGSTHELKNRVIACLNKLADRDTLALAAAELDSIARALNHDSFSPFLACIHGTDDSAKTPVRRHCVAILSLLSNTHADSLSPYLSRMVATVLRRIRDPDTAVRSACVEAAAAMAGRITRPPFAAAFVRPFVEAMATEQDAGAQAGAAMCLAAAIEAAPEKDPAELRRNLPRFGKMARSEGFKAKAALLGLIGSTVGAGGGSGTAAMDWLVPCLVEFLGGEDWAVRKAAAEVLGRVAAVERGLVVSHRDLCLSALESRRFDKVKVVRETMNQTLELWKDVSSSEEIVSPTQSRSSTDTEMGRCFPPLSKTSQGSSFKTPRPKKSTVHASRSPQSDSDGSSRNSINRGSRSPTLFVSSKKKPLSDWKIEIAVPRSPSSKNIVEKSEKASAEFDAKSALFGKTGGLRSGSRVVPFNCDDDGEYEMHCFDITDCCDAAGEEGFENQKDDSEDLCLIREQLLQIENQQTNLLDLIQRFIGSSQSGLNSLETRVNGIEIALEEMSYNMAMSSGRIPNAESIDNNTCCKLPGADFLSSKFWRRAEGRYSSQRFSSLGTMSLCNRDAGGELNNVKGFSNRSSSNIVQDVDFNGFNGA